MLGFRSTRKLNMAVEKILRLLGELRCYGLTRRARVADSGMAFYGRARLGVSIS